MSNEQQEKQIIILMIIALALPIVASILSATILFIHRVVAPMSSAINTNHHTLIQAAESVYDLSTGIIIVFYPFYVILAVVISNRRMYKWHNMTKEIKPADNSRQNNAQTDTSNTNEILRAYRNGEINEEELRRQVNQQLQQQDTTLDSQQSKEKKFFSREFQVIAGFSAILVFSFSLPIGVVVRNWIDGRQITEGVLEISGFALIVMPLLSYIVLLLVSNRNGGDCSD